MLRHITTPALLAWTALAATGLACAPSNAQSPLPATYHNDEVQLHVPEGWHAETNAQGNVILARHEEGTLQSRVQIRIMPYQAAFPADRMVDTLLAQAGQVRRLAEATSDNGEGRLVVAERTQDSLRISVAAAPDPARDLTLVALWLTSAAEFEAQGGPAFFARILESVERRGASDDAPAPASRPVASTPELFVMSYLEDLNLFTGAGGFKVRYLLLFPDGSFYSGLPREPLAQLDPAALRQAEPKRVGTWRRDGGELHLHAAGLAGTPYEHRTLTREGGGWKRKKDRIYRPVQAFSPKVLAGRWAYQSFRASGDTKMVGSQASVAASDVFVFHADGRFERTLAVGISGRAEVETGRGRATGSGAGTSGSTTHGTYTLSGLTLTLHHADGTVEHHILYAWPGTDIPTLGLGKKRFVRVDGA